MAAHKSPGLDWGLQPLRSGSIPDIRANFGYFRVRRFSTTVKIKRLKTASPIGFLYGCSVQAAHRLSVPDWGFQPLRPGSIPGARANYGCSVMAAHKSPGLDWGFQPLSSGSIPDIRATIAEVV